MKVVFIKKNNFIHCNIVELQGYKFKPRKAMTNLIIVDNDLIKSILYRKINNEIRKVSKAVKLIVSSDMAIVGDCDMMIKELIKLTKKIEKKYRKYFNEFEYFDLIKEIYELNMELDLKKKILENE